MPVGDEGAAQALDALSKWAQQRAQRPILFAIEPEDLRWLDGWTVREIGRQPLFLAGPEYDPELSGDGQPERGRELRRQARRALSKGVVWREVPAAQVWEWHQRGALEPLWEVRWQRQPLAEFSFVVALHLSLGHTYRRYLVLGDPAEGSLLGFAVIVASDRGWLLEHQLLAPDAPNGSGELLVGTLLSSRLAPGEWLSLGVTPLYRALVEQLPVSQVPGILSFLPVSWRRLLVRLWEPLYGFRRLQRYRDKLDPDCWEPVYWAHPKANSWSVMRAVLRVFAGGSLLGFAWATLEKLLAKLCLRCSAQALYKVNRFFVVSLIFWIPILWNLNGELLFGSAVAPKIWAVFDMVLVIGFVAHGRELRTRRRSWREGRRYIGGPVLLGLVVADALLSLFSTVMVHGGIPSSVELAAFLLALNVAPWLAVGFLIFCQALQPLFLRHEGRCEVLENP